MIKLPIEIVNNILVNYLSIYDNFGITREIEEYRNKKINSSRFIINKFIYEYVASYNHCINTYYGRTPKYIYKRYYPLIFRKLHIETYLYRHNEDDTSEIIKLYRNINKIGIVKTFNKYIDMISEDDLYFIGW